MRVNQIVRAALRGLPVFIGLGLLMSASAAHALSYTITNLGNLGYAYSSVGFGINDAGQVAGWSAIHATLRSNGSITDLGTLGGAYSKGYGINATGQVVGTASTLSGTYHAFLYNNGAMTDLGTLGGDNSYGFSINATGQVAGTSSSSNTSYHAFLYSNGVMTDLGDGYGAGINDAGQVAGYSQHAFIYSKGIMTDLGTLGGAFSDARGINAVGEVTGYSYTGNGDSHAYLYSNGAMTDLGTLGGTYSIGKGINAAGYVTGASAGSSGATHAFLYRDGIMSDLNNFIDPASGWALEEGTAINGSGQITGFGNHNGQYSAFLLTPVPLPESYAMLLVGLAMFGGAIRVRRK